MTAQGAPEAVWEPALGGPARDGAARPAGPGGRAAGVIHSAAPAALLQGSGSPETGVGARAKIWDEAACALRGRPESVKLARDFARETLESWGMNGLCDDVAWVISELVTNALNHGLPKDSRGRWARPIQVCLTMQLAHVLCMVSDPGGGAPVRKDPDHLLECGRGLQVVESCSDRWGWNPLDDGGKVVWAAFRVPD